MKQIIPFFIFLFFATITLAQNVGINTATPTYPLTIRSNGYGVAQESSTGTKRIGFYIGNLYSYLQTHDNTDLAFATNNASPQMFLQKGTGYLGIGGTVTPTRTLDLYKGRMRFTGDATGLPQGIEFTTTDGSALNGFIGNYNDSITGLYGFAGAGWQFLFNNKNGNVGLQGNNNPRAALSFANTLGNKIALYGNAEGPHYGMGIQGSNLQLYADIETSDISFGYGNSTNFTERMRIKGNGKVGIGTSTPSYPLTVRANTIGITQENITGSGKIGFYVGTNGETYLQTHTASDLYFATGGGGAQMTLQKTTGNLGVGISSPTEKLHVNGAVRITDGTQSQGNVLTSDANGKASWRPAAYGVLERFQFQFIKNSPANNGIVSTIYNVGTSTVSGTNTGVMLITIAKPGLYHFDVNGSGVFYLDPNGGLPLELQIYPSAQSINLSLSEAESYRATGNASFASIDKSFDLYVYQAGSYGFVLRTNSNHTDYKFTTTVTGSLISE